MKKKYTKKQLTKDLKKCYQKYPDIEESHVRADELLLKFINDKEVKRVYYSYPKWYAKNESC